MRLQKVSLKVVSMFLRGYEQYCTEADDVLAIMVAVDSRPNNVAWYRSVARLRR